tara:strand:+ start:3472 stop:4524 length:1053 start_codon:yes stop_codon:yes gene_type:complete
MRETWHPSAEPRLNDHANFVLWPLARLFKPDNPVPWQDQPMATAPDDKTSSGLLALVVGALRHAAPELLPAEPVMPDCAFATASASLKRSLLERALAARGPGFVLAMGQGVKQVGFEPLLYVLLRSDDPLVLFAKWQRFEQYTHSRHRTALTATGPDRLVLRRHALSGPAPEPCENLLIAGVLVALVEEIGGESVSLDWAGDEAGATDFILTWRSFTSRARTDSGDVPRALAATRPPLVFYGVDETSPNARRVITLMAPDITRDWSLAQLSRSLGQSPRSLQRHLSVENTSLSAIVRALRLREACHLLTHSAMTLTEIGYWCGFSDSPHFAREFRRALGMPPGTYRQSAA